MFLISSDPTLSQSLRDLFLIAAWLVGIPGLVFGYIAFIGYLREGPTALAEGRAAQQADAISEGSTAEHAG